ncbi:hypothetical protein NE865_01387 [Phthorimaea operculella]|nr:hypothetical protein NE865_01387 [Phthorimaea operculella]
MHGLLVLFAVVCVLISVDCMPVAEANKMIFSLPRQMVLTDNITITGLTAHDRKKVTLGLVKSTGEGKPDFGNVPCQIHLYYTHAESNRNTAIINSIVNSVATEEQDSGYEAENLVVGLDLDISFQTFPENGGKKIHPHIAGNPTPYLCEWSEDIRFLMVEGDVQKIYNLNYQLG